MVSTINENLVWVNWQLVVYSVLLHIAHLHTEPNTILIITISFRLFPTAARKNNSKISKNIFPYQCIIKPMPRSSGKLSQEEFFTDTSGPPKNDKLVEL